MPHKRNPIGLENVTSLCRYAGACFSVAFQNQITWDERDLANSANERIILPDISIVLDYVLHRFAGVMDKLMVFPKRMMKNLEFMKGLVYSQDVLSLFAERSGLPREEAYGYVRRVTIACWESGFELDFYEQLCQDPMIMQHISKEELKGCFDLEQKLKFVPHIFEMAFGKDERNAVLP